MGNPVALGNRLSAEQPCGDLRMVRSRQATIERTERKDESIALLSGEGAAIRSGRPTSHGTPKAQGGGEPHVEEAVEREQDDVGGI